MIKTNKPKIKNFCINISLLFISLCIFILFLEFVAFRFILIASDIPRIDFADGLVKYKPNQKGIYRIKDEINAVYKINANGWNSANDQYFINKPVDRFRIAIVGDSYVEATEVNFDESLAEKLENKLGKERFEVYRFGISGAPMSQYLHMLRKEVMKYNPDLVIVVLVHNDFNESYEFLQGTYASNFMKLQIEDTGDVTEVEPRQFIRPWYNPIRGSATWRYLATRQKIPYNYLKDLLLGNKIYYQANISIDSIKKNRIKNEIATNYIFKKMKEICENRGAKLLLIMNGVTEVVYGTVNKNESYKREGLSLNQIAKDAAQQNSIYFIDLEPVFEKDYKENKKRFTFINDGHWNVYGHEVVANTIFDYVKNNALFRKSSSRQIID